VFKEKRQAGKKNDLVGFSASNTTLTAGCPHPTDRWKKLASESATLQVRADAVNPEGGEIRCMESRKVTIVFASTARGL